MEPNYSVIWSAKLVGSTTCAVGNVLIPSASTPGRYVVATTENRGSRGAEGIALTAWSVAGTVGSVDMQQSGIIDASVSGLGSAATKQLVRTSATGTMERVASYTAGDDIIGYAELDGRVHLHFGIPWGQFSGTPGAPDKSIQWNDNGVFAGESAWTREASGRVHLTTSGYITFGSVLATFPSSGIVRIHSQSESTADIVVGRLGSSDWAIVSVAGSSATFGNAERGVTKLQAGENVQVDALEDVDVDAGNDIALEAGNNVTIDADPALGAITSTAAAQLRYAGGAAGVGTLTDVSSDVSYSYALAGTDFSTPKLVFQAENVSTKPHVFIGTRSDFNPGTQMFGVQVGTNGFVSLLASNGGSWRAGVHVTSDEGLATGVNGSGVVVTRNLAFTEQDAIASWAADPWGDGHGVFFFRDTTTKSASNPVDGIHLMVDETTHVLEYKKPSGATQQLQGTRDATLTTVDATVSTLDSFTIAADTVVFAKWDVVALRDDGSEGAAFRVETAFRNDAGVVAQIGTSLVTVFGRDDADWNADADNSTTTIRLRVTGEGSKTIKWRARLSDVTVNA